MFCCGLGLLEPIPTTKGEAGFTLNRSPVHHWTTHNHINSPQSLRQTANIKPRTPDPINTQPTSHTETHNCVASETNQEEKLSFYYICANDKKKNNNKKLD